MEAVWVLGLCQTFLWSPSSLDLRNMSQARLLSCQHNHFNSHSWLKAATWQPQLFAAKASLLKAKPQTPAVLLSNSPYWTSCFLSLFPIKMPLETSPARMESKDCPWRLSKEAVVTGIWETSPPWEWPQYIVYMKHGVYKHSILSYINWPELTKRQPSVPFLYASIETLRSHPQTFSSNCIFLPGFGFFIIGRVGWFCNMKSRGGGASSGRGKSSSSGPQIVCTQRVLHQSL